MRTLRAIAVAIAAALLLVSTGTADAKTETAQSGGVRAQFSFDYDAADYSYSNVWLTITRNGQTVFDDAVGTCDSYGVCEGPGLYSTPSILVRDLDGDGEPEVILYLSTEGAHCCQWTWIYRFNGFRYSVKKTDWADAGMTLHDLNSDGKPELVSADARFAYVFTNFAESYLPVRIYGYAEGRLAPKTRRFKAQIRHD